ncbi:MAG: hypothetical protein J5793_02125, partial [Clostridia bacterium]|nr:hypothetical protein [Clostridia bacterium]
TNRHRTVKRMLFVTVAAVIATFSIVYASYGFDILSPSSSSSTTSSSSSATSDTSSSSESSSVAADGYDVDITYTPTGANSVFTGDSALEDAKSWISSLGGDPDGFYLLKTEEPADGDTAGKKYYEVCYPLLPNKKPVFALSESEYDQLLEDIDYPKSYNLIGQYYIRFLENNTPAEYVVSGSFWIDNTGAVVKEIDGMSYDADTNTLTLSDYKGGGALDVNMLGNGFTIELIGENVLDYLQVWGFMYGGSVRFTGEGSLVINESRDYSVGLLLQAENSESCIIVENGVTLDIYGADQTVGVSDSTIEGEVLYLGSQLTIDGDVYDHITIS